MDSAECKFGMTYISKIERQYIYVHDILLIIVIHRI